MGILLNTFNATIVILKLLQNKLQNSYRISTLVTAFILSNFIATWQIFLIRDWYDPMALYWHHDEWQKEFHFRWCIFQIWGLLNFMWYWTFCLFLLVFDIYDDWTSEILWERFCSIRHRRESSFQEYWWGRKSTPPLNYLNCAIDFPSLVSYSLSFSSEDWITCLSSLVNSWFPSSFLLQSSDIPWVCLQWHNDDSLICPQYIL